jgi:hypothetical protein
MTNYQKKKSKNLMSCQNKVLLATTHKRQRSQGKGEREENLI